MARVAVAVAAAVACLALVPAALADGDPASDYLLSQPVFVPPDDGIPAAYAVQLTAVVAAAKAQGYVIRVALIGTRYDMGSVTVLYRQPKVYARFLGQELHFLYRGRLLVVMPNGYGVSSGGRTLVAGEAALAGFAPPGPSGSAIAAAASRAVITLAAKDGVAVKLPPLEGATGSSTTRDRIVLGVVALFVIVAVGGGTLLWRRLRRGAPT